MIASSIERDASFQTKSSSWYSRKLAFANISLRTRMLKYGKLQLGDVTRVYSVSFSNRLVMSLLHRIIGIGSPHGADRAGWLVAKRLAARSDLDASVCSVVNPLELMDHLDGCESLIVIDACITSSEVGSVIRLSWPDRRILSQRSLSSHGFGLGEAIQLADQLDRMPKSFVLYCLEIENSKIEERTTDAPIPGIDELERQVLSEVARWNLEQSALKEQNQDS